MWFLTFWEWFQVFSVRCKVFNFSHLKQQVYQQKPFSKLKCVRFWFFAMALNRKDISHLTYIKHFNANAFVCFDKIASFLFQHSIDFEFHKRKLQSNKYICLLTHQRIIHIIMNINLWLEKGATICWSKLKTYQNWSMWCFVC